MGVRVGVANFIFVRVGVAIFFLGHSIGIDEKTIMKFVGGLWAFVGGRQP